MIRFILTQQVQTGPETSGPIYKTIDLEVPQLEALLAVPFVRAGWGLAGVEVLPAGDGGEGRK